MQNHYEKDKNTPALFFVRTGSSYSLNILVKVIDRTEKIGFPRLGSPRDRRMRAPHLENQTPSEVLRM